MGDIAEILTAAAAEKRVREIRKNSSNVCKGTHARERMVERGISVTDLYRILDFGSVLEKPVLTKHGEWQCKIIYRLRGRRDAGAVTIFIANGKLFIKTVEWED